jgi:Flp pilus assembly pilin Flp
MIDRFNLWAGMLVARTQDLKNEDGQTAVEYVLMLALVVVGLVTLAVWGGLGEVISDAIDDIKAAL